MQPLFEFIRDHAEEILTHWEEFARTQGVGDAMDIAALRDHAQQILDAIVLDLQTEQSNDQQIAKSRGLTDARKDRDVTAAQKHGAGRAGSGFTVAQTIAEFRALRASVLRLWTAAGGEPSAANLAEVTRFNEAIDQVVAESIESFTKDLSRARNQFLAILGHDLVSPLNAIWTSARLMLDEAQLSERSQALVEVIESSASRMNLLVADLLDFTRTAFGDALPIAPVETDAREVIDDAVSEMRAGHPDAVVQIELEGDLSGRWDKARLAQMLSNLLRNALEHGADGAPVRVIAHGTPNEVEIAVHNEGAMRGKEEVHDLLQVMKTPDESRPQNRRHLGLGLYIVDKIVRAHEGTVTVDSTPERGTTLAVKLPRSLV